MFTILLICIAKISEVFNKTTGNGLNDTSKGDCLNVS